MEINILKSKYLITCYKHCPANIHVDEDCCTKKGLLRIQLFSIKNQIAIKLVRFNYLIIHFLQDFI